MAVPHICEDYQITSQNKDKEEVDIVIKNYEN